jgi:hypothetical protein
MLSVRNAVRPERRHRESAFQNSPTVAFPAGVDLLSGIQDVAPESNAGGGSDESAAQGDRDFRVSPF